MWPPPQTPQKTKVILVSRCAWTLFHFRRGLIEALTEGNFAVLGGGAHDHAASRGETLGVPFVDLPVSRNPTSPLGDLRLFWRLLLWYRREKPAIVHHFTIKPVIYGSIAARLAGVPRIINTVTGLGHVFTRPKGHWLRLLVESLYRVSLRCAHFTFFQNQEDHRLFIDEGLAPKGKSGLLPGSGVDCQRFKPKTGDSRPPESPVRFLMVARLLKEKGVYEFVEAARQVRDAHPRVWFGLLGRRDERNPSVVSEAEVEGWEAEGVVEWLGETEDVRPILASADVVVLPSYREGVPRALLEAAAMAKPIITTDVPGCREVVADGVNGLLVPAGRWQELAKAMQRMLESPELRRSMGAAGRTKVEEQFDERLIIERILESYAAAAS